MTDPQDLRAAYMKLTESIEANLAVTLGAGLGAAPITLDNKVRRFFNVIQRNGLGPRWHLAPAEDRIVAVGFWEKPSSNPHVHLAVRAPGLRLQEAIALGAPVWKDIQLAGDYWFDVIKKPHDYARYVTKMVRDPELLDRVFTYTPRAPVRRS